jgi:hypothetical protein
MTDKVVRDRHIVTAASETSSGGAGQAMVDDQMIFVNQDNTEAKELQDGSFEHPYRTLDQVMASSRYRPGAWVYVFSSDGQADTYANTRFTLLDDMVFWGEGYTHPVYGLGGGPNPILDGGYGLDQFEPTTMENTGVINLANNNEVMGFTVQNGLEGIFGYNIKGTYIHDNLVRWNGGIRSGIHIDNNWSPAEISGQTLSFRIANNQILENAGDGIYLVNNIRGDGGLNNTVIANEFTGNTVQGNGSTGVYSRIYASAGDTGQGITGSSFSNTVTGNTIGGGERGQGNGGDGIRTDIELYTGFGNSPVRNTSLTSRIENNSVIGNDGTGIADDYLYVYTGGDGSGIANVSLERYISGNEIRDNRYDGYKNYDATIYTWGADSPIADSSVTSHIDNNIISGNGRNAVEYWGARIDTNGSSSPISRASISNSFAGNRLDVAGEGYDGIHIYNIYIHSRGTASPLTDVAIANTFIDNRIDGVSLADDGIEIDENTFILASNPDSPIVNARITNTFTGNTVKNVTGDGLYFPGNYIRTGPFIWWAGDGTNSPISNAKIVNKLTGNTVTDNGGDGIYNWRNEIKSSGSTVADASTSNTYSGNTVERNGGDGIYLDEDFGGGSNTAMNYTFTDNLIRDNGGDGLYMYIDPSNGDLIMKKLLLQGNTITGNGGDGVEIYVNGTDPAMFQGDFGGGARNSTGGNTFAGNGGWDILHRGSNNMDIWALDNNWTNNADPESTICDEDDLFCSGDIITSQNQ